METTAYAAIFGRTLSKRDCFFLRVLGQQKLPYTTHTNTPNIHNKKSKIKANELGIVSKLSSVLGRRFRQRNAVDRGGGL